MSIQAEFTKGITRLGRHIMAARNRWNESRRGPIEVDSQGCEFGFEMYYHIGYAYHAYLQGRLTKTISCKDTSCFYWFSPQHEERYAKRGWVDWYNRFEHAPHQPPRFDRWETPNFKAKYADKINFGFKRPVIAVFNKYNIEWDSRPTNFLPKEWLLDLADRCDDQFDIVYFRPVSQIVQDHSELLELNEKEELSRQGVHLIEDLFTQHSSSVTFNELQLCVLANADVRVAVQGGATYLNALFPGKLAIFHRKGAETERGTYDQFSKMGESEIRVASQLEQLTAYVDDFVATRLSRAA